MVAWAPAWAAGTRFDAPIKLKVYERGEAGSGDRLLGFTPDRKKVGIDVPAGRLWYVRPMGAYTAKEWSQLRDVLNRHRVPGLDLSERWDLDDATLALLGGDPPVRLLQLGRTKVSDQGISQVSGFPFLETLSLSPKTTGAGLRALADLKNLKELDMRGSKVPEEALADLRHFKQLRSLVLNESVTDRGAAALAALGNLRELDVSATRMGDEGLSAVAKLSQLESFYAPAAMTDAGLASLSGLTKLKRLDLSQSRVTDGGLAALETLTVLEQLALTDTGISDIGMASVTKLRRLKTLELSGTRLTSSGLALVARLPNLETLSLSWQRLAPQDMEALSSCKSLKRLVLDGTPIPDLLMEAIRSPQKRTPLQAKPAPPAPEPLPKPSPARPLRLPESPAPAGRAHQPLMDKSAKQYRGLSGLRRLQRIETQSSELTDIISSGERRVASEPTPTQSVGEIDVQVRPLDR